MIVRLAELEIDPARFDAYAALLREEIDASVAREAGVLALHAVAERDRPGAIRVFEVYADQGAYETHLRSEHFLRYKTLVADMVRSLRLVAVEPLALRSKLSL